MIVQMLLIRLLAFVVGLSLLLFGAVLSLVNSGAGFRCRTDTSLCCRGCCWGWRCRGCFWWGHKVAKPAVLVTVVAVASFEAVLYVVAVHLAAAAAVVIFAAPAAAIFVRQIVVVGSGCCYFCCWGSGFLFVVGEVDYWIASALRWLSDLILLGLFALWRFILPLVMFA